MIYTLISNLPLIKKDCTNRKYFKLFLIGSVLYVLLHYYLFGKSQNKDIIMKYRKYIYPFMVCDLSVAVILLKFVFKCDNNNDTNDEKMSRQELEDIHRNQMMRQQQIAYMQHQEMMKQQQLQKNKKEDTESSEEKKSVKSSDKKEKKKKKEDKSEEKTVSSEKKEEKKEPKKDSKKEKEQKQKEEREQSDFQTYA